MEHKTKEPKARLTRRSTYTKIYDFIMHAAWHCRYGSNSDNTIRQPVPADLEAAVMLELYAKYYH